MDSDEVLERLHELARPALRLVKSERAGAGSKLGGSPNLPDGVEWPSWKGRSLAFLAQVDLSELPRPIAMEDWPSEGVLYFFYHPDQETWGFDPEDRGSWRVLHAPGQVPPTTRAAPETDAAYPEFSLRFEPIHSVPDVERLGLTSGDTSEETFDRADELKRQPFDGEPQHQMGGYPSPVQSDSMELECQLASNGVYCGGPGLDDPRVPELRGGAGEWKLLLQIDTDDEADIMWGDAGMLYFWIRRADLKRRDFSNVWMILQCG